MLARAFRPRVLVYASVLAAIVVGAAASLALRVPLKVDVIRDRAAIAREVEGGMVENVYRLQIMNTTETEREFQVSVEGLPTIRLASESLVRVDAAAMRTVPTRVRVQPGGVGPGIHAIRFRISAAGSEDISVLEKSVFIVR
jgi:polyferredoxin